MGMRLPRYDAQVKPPSQSGNALVEHPEYLTAGMKGIGADIEKAGMAGMKLMAAYEEEKQRAQDIQEKARLEAEMINDQYATEEMFYGDKDYNAFPERWDARRKELEGKYRGMVSNDKLWEVVQPAIQRHLGISGVGVRKLQRDKWGEAMELNVLQTGTRIKDALIREPDPVVRKQYEDSYNGLLEQSLATIPKMTPEKVEALRKTVFVGADFRRLENDAGMDLDEAYRRLTMEREKYYPNLVEDDTFKGLDMLEKIGKTQQREAEKERKEIYNAGATEAEKQWQAWAQGKNPKFEKWLGEQRANDKISEGTYRTFDHKIFMQKEKQENQMSPAKWKDYNSLVEEISNGTVSDIDDLFSDKRFYRQPQGQQGSLNSLFRKNIPIKNAMKREGKYLEDAMADAGVEADEKHRVRDEFRERTEGVEDTEKIKTIAKEIRDGIRGILPPNLKLAPKKKDDGKTEKPKPTQIGRFKVEVK